MLMTMKRPLSGCSILVALAVISGGCVEATPVGEPSAVPRSSSEGGPGGSEGGAGGSASGPLDAGVGGVGGAASPGFAGPPENCRWQGYGIGPLGSGQCSWMHLFEHSLRECDAEHGAWYGQMRSIVDACLGEGDEAQVLCCFADGVPDPQLTDSVNSVGKLLTQSDPPSTRTDMLARAAEMCAQSSGRLGDWSLRYAADGTTPDALRFGCR
jgi:hypothetical protein